MILIADKFHDNTETLKYRIFNKYDTKRKHTLFYGTLPECQAWLWLKENNHIIK